MANKILLGGHPDREYSEGPADATITPGDLVKRTTTGFIRHATAGGDAMPSFALNALSENKGIDDDYASGSVVTVVHAKRGDMINALLAASATAVVLGDYVESAGNGTVRKHVAQQVVETGSATTNIQAGSIIGVALESVDNSAGGTKVRLRIEIR